MKRKKNNFYKKHRVLKTAMEGFDVDDTLPDPEGGYSRQDEKKQIQEALEEIEIEEK